MKSERYSSCVSDLIHETKLELCYKMALRKVIYSRQKVEIDMKISNKFENFLRAFR